jgi:hypothetical protein
MHPFDDKRRRSGYNDEPVCNLADGRFRSLAGELSVLEDSQRI